LSQQDPPNQQFHPTEYIAPVLLVLLALAAGWWLLNRVWTRLYAAPPPQAGPEIRLRSPAE
jgi:hypothetical protein